MKKSFYLIPVLALMFSCSGEKQQTEKSTEVLQEEIEAIEKSTQQLDEAIKSSDDEIEQTQSEIDSLLSNI
ncbi:MAG: hypothetical protein AB7U05_18450 [Mangrovibacterium sp.]